MSFSEKFIRRPIMTVLIMITLIIFGVVAYTQLPVSDLPAVDYPVMTISVSYPGASSQLMASAVASPLEDQCMEIQGLTTVISSNTPGSTSITLGFELDKNVDLVAPDVQAAITRALSNLPTDLPQQPTYDKSNPSDQPIIYIMVSSDTLTGGALYDYGNTLLAQRINMIEGISKVDIYGAQRAIRIKIDADKLSALGLSFGEVAQALGQGTVTIPGGDLNGPYRTFSLEPDGQLTTPEEYEELVIAYREGSPIRIRDVGVAIDSLQNDLVSVMYGGPDKPMKSGYICIAATKSPGSNAVALSQKVRDLVAEIEPTLPGSLELDFFYDQAIQIKASIDDVKQTIVIALILVVLVIFLFLGRVSDTMVPGLVLPVTLFGTFLAMFFAGFSLDNLSLMALTLSIGFLVDDAIVVLENTVRYIQQGKKPVEAAIVSMEEISGTVVSTSLALITVFVPLVFMGGVIGKNFQEFALVVIMAIAISTVMALTLSPMMCARVLKGGEEQNKPRLERFIENLFARVVGKYGSMLDWFLRRKILAILGWIGCLVGIAYFFSALPKSFMPIGDSGTFYGQFMGLLGTSTDQIRAYQDKINAIVVSHPEIERLLTVTGQNPGSDQSTGLIIGTLKEQRDISTINMVNELYVQLLSISNLGQCYIMPKPSLVLATGAESTATGSKYSYVLSGQDKDEVYSAAFKLVEEMEKTGMFSGIQNSVKLNMPQINIRLKRDRASALGITAEDIENALAFYYAKGKTATYLTDIQQYWIMLEAGDDYRQIPLDLNQVYLPSPNTGELVPLLSVADWDIGVGPQDVPHDNRLNAATISYNLAPGAVLGTAQNKLDSILDDILTPGVGGRTQGEAQEFEDAVKSLSVLLLVAIFIMYIILGILYESYIHPFTVLTTLPPAAFGGLLTLYVFGQELSIYAYIGLFMLLGIVSKNGIMMVDFAKEYMEDRGLDPFNAILEACKDRFRPILMTSASTIMGTLPIALGYGADGTSRQPLGLVIAGGLLFAQVVTLFITPGIFLYMQTLQEKFLDRFELTRSVACRLKMEKEGKEG